MYTVIFTDKSTSKWIASYRFLFRPFELNGDVAFCNWNENGVDVESAVPQLPALLRGKREWRAIILNTDAANGYASVFVPDPLNPFDYSDADSDKGPHESPVPVIRLSHIIGGYDIHPKCKFEEGYEYYDERLKKIIRVPKNTLIDALEREGTDAESEGWKGKFLDLKSVYLEVEASENIVSAHRRLYHQYQFEGARPAEILFVGLRGRDATQESERIAKIWHTPLEMRSSSFWEKNYYPANARFLCSDISLNDVSKCERELTLFWLSVLALSTNRIPSAFLQAYRLYRLNIEIDSEAIQTVLNCHLDRVLSARDMINEELAKDILPSFGKVETLVPIQHVPVVIEEDDQRKLFDDTDLSQVNHVDEAHVLKKHEAERKEKFNEVAKDPRRAIERAAKFLRESSMRFPGKFYDFDATQYELLQNHIRKLEKDILTTRPVNRYDRNDIASVTQSVQREIDASASQLMSKKNRNMAFVIAAMIVIFGFVQYLWHYFKHESLPLYPAFIVTTIMVLLTFWGGYLALKFNQFKEKKLLDVSMSPLKQYERIVAETRDDYSRYFTDICTLMKANAMLDGTRLCEDSETLGRRSLYEHLRAMDEVEERDIKWLRAYEMQRIVHQYARNSVLFDSDIPPMDNALYYFELDEERLEMPLNASGEYLYSPYRFMKCLLIERVELFDSVQDEAL